MIRFSNTVDIARPPSEVFAYLADLEHTRVELGDHQHP